MFLKRPGTRLSARGAQSAARAAVSATGPTVGDAAAIRRRPRLWRECDCRSRQTAARARPGP